MRDPQNIIDVGGLHPDFMGFIFYTKSPRYIGDLDPKVIKSLPKQIKRVGVFVNETIETIEKIMLRYSLDYVQLHGDETPQFCTTLKQKFRVIKATTIDKAHLYEKCVTYLLFDTPTPQYGGSGERFDWQELKKYKGATPYFLSGGISIEHIDEIKKMNLFAVDLNSRFEISPANKNVELLKKFIDEQN